MVKLALVSATLILGLVAPALAAEQVDNVCLVVYGDGEDARTDSPKGVASAAVMPRVSAVALMDDYRKIYVYDDEATMIRACQCLHNPAPAYSISQRDQALRECPKPTRIEQARELPKIAPLP